MIGEELPYLLTVVNPVVQQSLQIFQVHFDALLRNVPDLNPDAPLWRYPFVLEHRLGYAVFFGLAHANPAHRFGFPASGRSLVPKVMAALLGLAGIAAEPGAIAKRLSRHETFCAAVECYKKSWNL